MAIGVDRLRSAATRSPAVVRSLSEAKTARLKGAFLCHSHKDADLAKGLVNMFAEAGWRIYVDWADVEMPDTPNRETAKRIQQKIVELDWFLFLATSNSMSSRWCPWEIGYADGKKHIDQIFVIPTQDGQKTYGNEYLQLYRRIDLSALGQLATWKPGETQAFSLTGL